MRFYKPTLLALCSVALPLFISSAIAAPSRSSSQHVTRSSTGAASVQGYVRRAARRHAIQVETHRVTAPLTSEERDSGAPLGTALFAQYTAADAAAPLARSRKATRKQRAAAAADIARQGAQVLTREHGESFGAAGAPSYASGMSSFASVSGSSVIAEARRYMGTNPTKRRSLWCGDFMNMVLERTGHPRSRSNQAKSFASYGTRVSGPQVGAIAVMSRGRAGGHVGIVTGFDASGNPVIISGNHRGRVAEVPYPRGRIFAYVMPTS